MTTKSPKTEAETPPLLAAMEAEAALALDKVEPALLVDKVEPALLALDKAGAHFVLTWGEKEAALSDKRRPKGAKETGWPNNPAAMATVLAHFRKGVPIGVIPASLGCVVVDVDRGGTKTRDEVIALLGTPLAIVQTQRVDGWHLWYRCRDAAEVRNGNGWRDGDLRGGKSGFIILWHPEIVVEALGDKSRSLINLMATDLARLPPKKGEGKGGKKLRGPKAVAAAAEGDRNGTLNKQVFLVATNHDLTDKEIQAFSAAAVEAGLSKSESDTTIASAIKAGYADRPQPGEVVAFPTDLSPEGLHRLWLANNGEDWKYLVTGASSTGTWVRWTGQRYKPESPVYAFRDVARLVASVAHAASRGEGAEGRRGAVRAMKNSAFTVDVTRFNRAARVDQFEDYDQSQLSINTPTGVVRLDTGDVAGHDRSQKFLKIAGAGPATGAADLWRKCLNEWCADDEMVSYLQRLVGYSLRGDNQSHAVIFVYGGGANGKTTFLKVWQALLGDYARPCSHRLFVIGRAEDHLTALAGLAGTRLASIPEVPTGARWDEEALKQMSGGDKLTARFMRQDYFDFTPQFLPVVVGNNAPTTRDVGESMRRRLHVIPFTESFDKAQAIPDLAERLIEEELPAIMKWAIDGHIAYMAQGLAMPAKVANETAKYFETNDHVGQFLSEFTTEDPKGSVGASVLFSDYTAWMLGKGERAQSQTVFGGELTKRGYTRKRGGKGNYYRGLALKDGGF